jgi:hypothetical protein
MGICQSRPEVESNNASHAGGGRPASAKQGGGKGSSMLLRRRPSDTSLCTIIPEATDHDNDDNDLERMMWNDETDADSLTESGKVYRKQAPHPGVVTKGGNINDAASPALTEPTAQSSVAETTAASSNNKNNNKNGIGGGIRQRQANYLRALRGSSSSSGSGSAGGLVSPNSFATTLASPFSSASSGMSASSSPLPSSALLHEYDDDDSTALPAEDDGIDDDDIDDEEEDQAPTDEEDNCERGDPDEPGRLVPVSPTPITTPADKESAAQASLASPSSAEAAPTAALEGKSPNSSPSAVSPSRSVDAPGRRAASLLLQRSMLDSSVVSTSPSASFSQSSLSAVHPRTLSEFHRIEIQSKLAKHVQTREAKAQKYNDRYQDVQGYKQLYKEFEQLTHKVNSNQGEGSDGGGGSAGGSVSVASPDPTTASSSSVAAAASSSVLSPPKTAEVATTPAAAATTSSKFALRGRSTTPASALGAASASVGHHSAGVRGSAQSSSRRTQSFDLHDSNNWFFDFQGTEFVYEGGVPQPQPQATLSLLSESSLEVQRRLYAEKRRQRKMQKKMKLWRGTPGRSHAGDETAVGVGSDAAKSSSVSTPMSSLMSTMSSIVRRDYGPVRQSRSNGGAVAASSGSVVDNNNVGYGLSTAAPALMTLSEMPPASSSSQGEWVDQEINCVGNVGGNGPDDAEYSYLSDMGDTASYTSNDYRVGPSRRFPASSMYGSRAGSGSATATQVKLSELEAKILALERANSNVSSPRGDSTAVAASASTPVATSSAAAPGDNLKTPVVTNRVASLRTIFEPASNHPGVKGQQDSTDDVSSNESEPRGANMVFAAPSSSVGEPTVAFVTPMHQLESIEESLVSAASSVSSPVEDASPTKSLLGEGRQSESPNRRGDDDEEVRFRGSIHEELFPADGHVESIDLPPDEDEETIDLLQEPSPVPIASADSDIPALRQLDTISTGASLDEEEEKKEEEDGGADPLRTPVKECRASPPEMSGDDEGDDEDDNDIFNLLARGNDDADDLNEADQLETITPTKLPGSTGKAFEPDTRSTPCLSGPSMYMVPKKVPVDPPGAALLDGTPSLETKRRPYRPMESLLSPTSASTGSTPTPQVSPVRRMPMASSPAGSQSPKKNRWIAELSTHQFLAISEENALERLARLERNESTPTMFDTDPVSMEPVSSPGGDTVAASTRFVVASPVDVESVYGEQLIANAEIAAPHDSLTIDGSSNQVKEAQLEAADPPAGAISGESDGDASTRSPADCIGSVLFEGTVENTSVDAEVVEGAAEHGEVVPDAAPFLSEKEQFASDVPAFTISSEERIVSDPTEGNVPIGTEQSEEESRPSESFVHVGSVSPPTLLQFQSDEVTAETIDYCAPGTGVLDEEHLESGSNEGSVASMDTMLVLDDASSRSSEVQDEVKMREEHSVVSDSDEKSSLLDDAVSERATSPGAMAESVISCDAVVEPATTQQSAAAVVQLSEDCPREGVERTSVSTAATSFVTAISSSAVLMEAWDDTAEHEDAYASFGTGGDLKAMAIAFAEGESPVKRSDISVLDTSQHGTDADVDHESETLLLSDAPPKQVSPTEGGIVIDKSFASIARVSPMILATDNSSNAYFNGSMRSAPRSAAAAEYDDAPHDELHSDESMSVINKSHMSHEGEDASYHSDSTRPSTNVKSQAPVITQPAVVEDDAPLALSATPKLVGSDDEDSTNVVAARTSSPSSESPAAVAPVAPWSKSLALASAVEQQVQQVLERYRQEGSGNADDDDEAPEDERSASLSVSRTH